MVAPCWGFCLPEPIGPGPPEPPLFFLPYQEPSTTVGTASGAVALPLLRELRQRRRTPVRLLGVGLSGLIERDTPAQLGLFPGSDPVESDRDRMLARVVDDLRDRFGRSAVLPGRVLEREP